MTPKSLVSSYRTERAVRQNHNPISGLRPDALTTYLDSFRRGEFAQAALLWELIEHRDDVLDIVAPRRKTGVARHGWEIVLIEETAEAAKQKVVLEKFYNNITASSALDLNEQGGFALLCNQMMDAVGKRYAVHEILWNRNAEGRLTANFRFVPLWFFEGTTGVLRYLPNENTKESVPLQPGKWMITCGRGIMEASSLAWLAKYWALKDWALYSGRHGMPWVKGVSQQQYHSPEWENMRDAIDNFTEHMAGVFAAGGTVDVISTTNAQEPPYEAIVDRMDRAIARLWLGSDLATLSRQSAVGASLQGDSSEILAAEDSIVLGEVLAKHVSKYVLEDVFGEDCPRLAYLKLRADPKKDIEMDLRIDKFLATIGIPLGVRSVLERYGRPLPGPNEAVASIQPKPEQDQSLTITE